MPQGNDKEAAARELEASQGVAGNAERLIEELATAYPKSLRAANGRPVNAAATHSLDRSAIEKHDDVDGDEVLDYAVRGSTVVAVVADESGRSRKVQIPLDDLGRAGRRAADAGAESDDDASLRAKSREGDNVGGDADSGDSGSRASQRRTSSRS